MDEIIEDKPKKKKVERVPVRVIAHHASTTLVEWSDGVSARRAFVPDMVLDNGKVAQDELDAGIEYGIPWDKLIVKNILVDARDICAALRANGIWTLENVHANPGVINGILVSLMGDTYKQIITQAENFDKNDKNEVKNG